MPIYCYKCKKTGLEVEVLRSFEDYEIPPKDEELPEDKKGLDFEWERMIGSNIAVQKPYGWGKKGHW